MTIQNGIVRCGEVLRAAQLAHMSQHRFAGEVMKKRIMFIYWNVDELGIGKSIDSNGSRTPAVMNSFDIA